MKRALGTLALALSAAGVASAQDPSDAIYDPAAMRTFRLTMSAGDWNAIVNGDGDTWRRADMTWEGETVLGVGVKASGHGTLTARQKQSIRISFNEFEFDAAKRKWRGVNRIKLDSMEGNVDHSMMRDRIAFDIMRAAGNAAPRLAHCHLHVNGAYKGLYIAAEPVKKDFLRYRWGGDNDGNLFEQDGHGPAAYDWRGTSPGSYVPGWFIEENAAAPVNYGDLVQLLDTVNNKAGDDRRNQLAALVDYPVLMRHLAVTTVYGDGDDIAHWGGGWCNNHFWYHHEGGKMRVIKWETSPWGTSGARATCSTGSRGTRPPGTTTSRPSPPSSPAPPPRCRGASTPFTPRSARRRTTIPSSPFRTPTSTTARTSSRTGGAGAWPT
jgi:spore coat protein CotH